jgi:serine/threonine-protein kinase
MSETPQERAEALVGRTLGGRFRLEALIGQGAMGAVFRASHAQQRELAVKTLDPEMMGGEHAKRFLRESELVRGLRDPHIVPSLGAGIDRDTGLLYLVMPLLHGRDLEKVLEEVTALEPETAVRVALQAARGLSAAHQLGIVHRDVKPGNLMLEQEDGRVVVRVCDFGIAKRVGGGDHSLTRTGKPLGTPDYVAPEQLKSSKHVDQRADVWSLGATLYQMLCGSPPFSHIESVFDLITAIVSEPVPPLQDRAPWVDPTLALAVHRALERDPARRYASVGEFADAIRPFSRGEEHITAGELRSVAPETQRKRLARLELEPDGKPTSVPAPNPPKPSAPSPPPSATAPARPRGSARRTFIMVLAVFSAAMAGGTAYYLARLMLTP